MSKNCIRKKITIEIEGYGKNIIASIFLIGENEVVFSFFFFVRLSEARMTRRATATYPLKISYGQYGIIVRSTAM